MSRSWRVLRVLRSNLRSKTSELISRPGLLCRNGAMTKTPRRTRIVDCAQSSLKEGGIGGPANGNGTHPPRSQMPSCWASVSALQRTAAYPTRSVPMLGPTTSWRSAAGLLLNPQRKKTREAGGYLRRDVRGRSEGPRSSRRVSVRPEESRPRRRSALSVARETGPDTAASRAVKQTAAPVPRRCQQGSAVAAACGLGSASGPVGFHFSTSKFGHRFFR